MLGAILKAPELEIEKDEAKQLATAAGNVMRHYDVRTTQKALDWAALGVCAGTIYGGRLIALSIRQRRERAERAEQAPPAGANGAGEPTIVQSGMGPVTIFPGRPH